MFWRRNKKQEVKAEDKKISLREYFGKTNGLEININSNPDEITDTVILRKATDDLAPECKGTMDSLNGFCSPIPANCQYQIDALQLAYFADQSFIGYPMCGILSQNWLIRKSCAMPAKDAIRNGFKITKNDGEKLDPEVLQEFEETSKKYKLFDRMREFVTFGRIFGVRVAIFQVESKDPKYYEKPFNIDGVTPGSYRGISMVDPYWIAPLLDADAVSNPASQYFYEPTWWSIQGKRVHRTHVIVFRTEQPPDTLKPTYYYGGIPLTQQIMRRVYNAERTSNEAPLLVMTKRLNIMKVDLEQAIANPGDFNNRVLAASQLRDNHGYYAIDHEDDITQTDTALSDLDSVIMTQYQLVAAVANVPATKLLGTQPKGFNTTGEYEEANYHEELESIQAHDLTPFLDKHLQLVIKSDIAPKFGLDDLKVKVTWEPLDAMTAKEKAEVNEIDSRSAANYVNTGAIDAQDIRNKLIADEDSGYNGLSQEVPMEEDDQFMENENAEEEKEEDNNDLSV